MVQRSSIDRRDFVASALCAGLAALAPGLAVAAPRRALAGTTDEVRVALLVPTGAAAEDAIEGARMGAAEAERAATLLGRGFTLVEADPSLAGRDVEIAAWLREQRALALVGGFGNDGCVRVAHTAAAVGALFINAGCTADALRGEGCAPHIFHVAASARMLADARALHDAGDAPGARITVELWHPSLARFGAEQVNERFRERTGRRMSSTAWAAWAAVKFTADAALRMRGADAVALARQLRAPAMRFDGHKGRPLSFRAWDQQLRQPLYLVEPGGAGGAGVVIAEVPDARGDAPPAALLDRLGATDADSVCALAAGAGA